MFFWQLFVSRSKLSSISSTAGEWTTFELPALTPSQMPGSITDIGRFLTASLPFMANLEVVTVALDSHILLRLHKCVETRKSVPLRNGLDPKIRGGLMTVSELVKTELTLWAKTYTTPGSNGILISPNIPRISFSSIHALGANVAVSLDTETEEGLKKILKKNKVLKNCHFQMVYVSRLMY
jgi:hypothetical protein